MTRVNSFPIIYNKMSANEFVLSGRVLFLFANCEDGESACFVRILEYSSGPARKIVLNDLVAN